MLSKLTCKLSLASALLLQGATAIPLHTNNLAQAEAINAGLAVSVKASTGGKSFDSSSAGASSGSSEATSGSSTTMDPATDGGSTSSTGTITTTASE